MSRVFYRWEASPLPHPCGTMLRKLAKRAMELARLPEGDWDLSIRFLADHAMARANETYVGHEGTTDVITFSYLDDPASCFPGETAVELLICAGVARREGLESGIAGRSYGGELALYLVHGLLHASGEDDLDPVSRRRMRSREREVMTALEREFDLKAVFPAPARLPGAE